MTFVPTHAAPVDGCDTWSEPDAAQPIGPSLPGRSAVRVLRWWGDWAQIECSNGWTAWIDGRRLDVWAASPVGSGTESVVGSAGGPHGAVDRAAGWLVRGGVTVSLPLVGAIATGLATFLPWVRAVGVSFDAMDLYARVLFDPDAPPSGLRVGLLLLMLAAAAGALSIRPYSVSARRLVGAVIAGVALLFIVRLRRALDGQPADSDARGLLDVLGPGACLALAAGVSIVVGRVRDEGARR